MVALLFQNKSSLCENSKGNRNRSQFSSRWRRSGNLKVKISDFKVHFCRLKHFFGETCRSNLIANIILLGLKLFISGSGGSL